MSKADYLGKAAVDVGGGGLPKGVRGR
jgi:hypothetical protein